MRNLLSLFLILFTVSVTAQTAEFDKFRFGLQFSPNIGWMNPDNAGFTKNGSKIGFSYGLLADFNLSPRYAVFTGLNVTKINTSTNYNYPGTPGSYDISAQYIDIPLSLKLKTNEIGYMTYFGKFGLSAGYNLKSKVKDSSGERDFGSEIQPVRLALLVGIGTEYNISGFTRILIGVDFNNGFTNLYTKKAGNDISGNKLKAVNNYIALNLGVYF